MTRFLAVNAIFVAVVLSQAQSPNECGPVVAGVGGPTCTVCVVEPKSTTKTVYGSVCKEFCRPECSLLSLLRKCGGCATCDCGAVRTRNVLVKKVVPGREVPACVLKEVPAECPQPVGTKP
jgi:hypothetical protein